MSTFERQRRSLLLTLLVTPILYSYFDDLAEFRWSRLFARGKRAEPVTDARQN